MVRLAKADTLPGARPAINDTQSMMGTAEVFVDYYRRALQGEFFTKPESLTEFRRIQAMADAIANVMPPNIPTYAKGGSIDWNGFYAVSLPGQAWVGSVPVGFCFTLNWNRKDGDMDAMMPKLRVAVKETMAAVVKALS
jgi:beta-lactamase class A